MVQNTGKDAKRHKRGMKKPLSKGITQDLSKCPVNIAHRSNQPALLNPNRKPNESSVLLASDCVLDASLSKVLRNPSIPNRSLDSSALDTSCPLSLRLSGSPQLGSYLRNSVNDFNSSCGFSNPKEEAAGGNC